jgi:UDP-2,3-diacylglucosamine pyrophosphatase LpxH
MNAFFPHPLRYRAIFISDVHLGTRRAQTRALLDFLRATESDWLYIVGDLVDNWALRKEWYWDQFHNDVVQKLLRKARKGTKIVYIPGNHDEHFRDFLHLRFGRVSILPRSIHLGANGKRYLVLHGDQFDHIVCYAPWLARMGDTAYELSMALNGLCNSARRLLKLPYWSLSGFLKHRVKKAVEFISRFEKTVVHEARKQGAQGVICGHIHTPDDREIDGIHYLNDGDWVENCTALVEHHDGRFEIVKWSEMRDRAADHAPPDRHRRLASAG